MFHVVYGTFGKGPHAAVSGAQSPENCWDTAAPMRVNAANIMAERKLGVINTSKNVM